MKHTIFKFNEGETNIEHKVDFIYELPTSKFGDVIIHLNDAGSFSVRKIIDQFTNNPDVQIRHIFLVRHEKQII